MKKRFLARLRAAAPVVAVVAIDLAGIAGAGLMAVGAGLVYLPAGLIVGGVLLLVGAIAISRGRAV